ncbi:MAG: ABC transporter permease subunit [Myxococcales bacterium]|nr:ABC transporter permease subunit [Myxococcales bacterium]
MSPTHGASRPSVAWREPGARRLLGALLLLVVLGLAVRESGADFGRLLDARGLDGARDLLAALLHPDLSPATLALVAGLAGESLLIGLLGTALACLMGGALAVVAARMPRLVDGPREARAPRLLAESLRLCARFVLAIFRAVPELVWAFLFVRIIGLGPGAAVLALGVGYAGAIGKVFAEQCEAADPGPARQLRAAGAGRTAVFLHAVAPQVARPCLAYALFRLECAIRSASILGVVGAGGLGAELELSIRYFQLERLATLLLAIILLVTALEVVSAVLRRARPGLAVALVAGGALVAVLRLPIAWSDLVAPAAVTQARAFAASLFNPALDTAFLLGALDLARVTVAMALAGTLLAALPALLVAPLAARTALGHLADPPRGRHAGRLATVAVLAVARALLQVSRAVPDLVFALLFVLCVGPGPLAGVLAIAVHTFGVLGRLYGDALDDADPRAARALETAGSGRLARLLHAVLPQVAPRLLAFTLYRFEVNVRVAAMVGFVGAGGLGDAIHTAVSLFHLPELAALLLVLLAVVVVIDAVGDALRARAQAAAWG